MKKPMFKGRIGWASQLDSINWCASNSRLDRRTKVRITDAREPSAREVARRILQAVYDQQPQATASILGSYAADTGFAATVKNGKVEITKGIT